MKPGFRRRLWLLLPCCAGLLLSGCSTGVFDPSGRVGADERAVILIAAGLMLVVVIPVIGMTIAFAWRYRASNDSGAYAPQWAQSDKIEAIVWLVPCAIVVALAALTWMSAHRLDPYRPIPSAHRPITIEVVALDWKWLFIYPDLNIATVNEVAFPVNDPVTFHVTSNSVMNSFFIPQLGSQIYAMAGMETRLNLIADEAGTYDGISANYSGAGFSDMKFKAMALRGADFDKWVDEVRESAKKLDDNTYSKLALSHHKAKVTYFSSADPHLFRDVLHSYASGSGERDLRSAAKG